MGWTDCGCSLKTKSLVAAGTSLVVSVMVMFFTLKEIIFESNLIDSKIKNDIVVVSAVAIIFTVVLIAGIIKEARHLFLPWLFSFAIAISTLFLYSLYLVVFCFQTDALIGSILFIASAFCYYGWITVAALYSHLKDMETEADIERRRYSEVVTTSDGTDIFRRTPPPPYSITYQNTVANEKPPPYEEVRASELNRY